MAQYDSTSWSSPAEVAARSGVAERLEFVKKTYLHLAFAILAFIVVEWALLQSSVGERFALWALGTKFGWLGVLVAFMLVGNIAERWARTEGGHAMHYAGLSLFVAAEAIIFLPLIYLAIHYSSPDVLPAAAITTLSVFVGLTLVALLTRTDFTFMGGALKIGGMVGLGTIVCSILFGFNLGVFFAFLMAALMGGYVLYYTSQILRTYRTDQPVAAALALFASVATMFWFILQIFMSRD